MYICPLFCLPNELLELDAPVASPFTMESVGASVVGVRVEPATPEDTSGETDDVESRSGDEEWGNAMERGDAMKLTRRGSTHVASRTHSATSTVSDTSRDVITGESSGAIRWYPSSIEVDVYIKYSYESGFQV
jgi:hypothetical protein